MPTRAHHGFFPKRPAGVETFTIRGVLTAYGYGMSRGGFVIIANDGTPHAFLAPTDVKINGMALFCRAAPQRGMDPVDCASWPRTLIVGKTMVTVTYWHTQTPEGVFVNASDEIDY